MWQTIIKELTQATLDMVHGIFQFLPRLAGMLIVVVFGWVIAYILKSILRTILRLARFDKLSEHAGATQLLKKAALPSSTELLSRFVFWVAWIGFILIGVSVLGIVGMQEHVGRFFGFLPRLFAALFVFFFGWVASSFFSRAALLPGVKADLPSARLIRSIIRTLLIVFSVSIGFEALGLAVR